MTPHERALRVLAAGPLVDGNSAFPYALRLQTAFAGGPLSEADLAKLELDRVQPLTRTDLHRLAAGRVGAQFWSVAVPDEAPFHRALLDTLHLIDLVQMIARKHADRLVLAGTAAEIGDAFRTGRTAVLLSAEDFPDLAGTLGVLRILHRLGVRCLAPVHAGDRLVQELNRIGVVVDCSRLTPDRARLVLRAGSLPVMFSHSAARALCPHPANVPPDVLADLTGNGGVCMVTFEPALVSADRWAWQDAGVTGAPPPVTVAHVADHIDHVRDTAGVDHVGIGGHFDGCADMPAGLEDVSGYPLLVAELAGRGWSDGDLSKLAGGNVLRVLREVESGAEI